MIICPSDDLTIRAHLDAIFRLGSDENGARPLRRARKAQIGWPGRRGRKTATTRRRGVHAHPHASGIGCAIAATHAGAALRTVSGGLIRGRAAFLVSADGWARCALVPECELRDIRRCEGQDCAENSGACVHCRAELTMRQAGDRVALSEKWCLKFLCAGHSARASWWSTVPAST